MHTHPRVLSNIWRPGQVRNSKFGMNVPSENPINAAKSQVYSFDCFCVIEKNYHREGKNNPHRPNSD